MKTTRYTNFSTYIFEGFYESNLYNSDKLYGLNKADGTEVDVDFPSFEKEVCEKATSLLEKYTAGDVIYKIEFVELNSPSEYNHRTDRLVLNVEYDEDKLGKFLIDNKEDFDKYLRENWSSCPGFISFVPNNYEEFFDYWEDDGISWKVALEYYILRRLFKEDWNPKEVRHIETDYHYDLWEAADEILHENLFEITK